MKKFAVVLCAIVLGACAYKHQPIYNVEDPMPPNVAKLSSEQIEALIVEGGQTHDWKFQHVGTGHLIATQSKEKFQAVVDIYFDQKSWRIAYQSSVGMRAEDGTIHSHYNTWIHNLEHDIDVRLTNAAFKTK